MKDELLKKWKWTYEDQMNTRSSWRNALISSPPNPSFSFGISRGPSPIPGRAPGGLPGAPGGAAMVVIGASEVPLTSEPMPGTPLASTGFGGVPTGPSCWAEIGGVCFNK